MFLLNSQGGANQSVVFIVKPVGKWVTWKSKHATLREGRMEEIRLARDSLFGCGSRSCVVCGTPSRVSTPRPLYMSKEPGVEGQEEAK